MSGDPIDRIEWRDASLLDANSWNPNRVHKAELRLLERSILQTGWVQPILINPDGLIIDGFHRWRLSLDSKRIREKYQGRVPCAVLDLDRAAAMLLTIRINRAKGTHVAVSMSEIVRELVEVHQLPLDRIAAEMGASMEEVSVLAQDGVFEVRNIKDWAYSPAWYPAIRKKGDTADAVVAAPAEEE